MPRGENLERDRPPREVLAARFGVEPLAPGERSEKVRIRGSERLFEALERLSPLERGRVVEAGLEARERVAEAVEVLEEAVELVFREVSDIRLKTLLAGRLEEVIGILRRCNACSGV